MKELIFYSFGFLNCAVLYYLSKHKRISIGPPSYILSFIFGYIATFVWLYSFGCVKIFKGKLK